MNRLKLFVLGVVVLSAILLIPWKSQIVPEWKLKVVDESGSPIPRLCLSEDWVEPDFWLLWNEQDYWTDENGLVIFPERSTWRNGLLVIISRMRRIVLAEKTTWDAMAFGWGSYARGEVYYRKGQALPEKLVMYR